MHTNLFSSGRLDSSLQATLRDYLSTTTAVIHTLEDSITTLSCFFFPLRNNFWTGFKYTVPLQLSTIRFLHKTNSSSHNSSLNRLLPILLLELSDFSQQLFSTDLLIMTQSRTGYWLTNHDTKSNRLLVHWSLSQFASSFSIRCPLYIHYTASANWTPIAYRCHFIAFSLTLEALSFLSLQ